MLEDRFAMSWQELRQNLHDSQRRTDAKPNQLQRIIRSAIEPLQAWQHAMEGRLSAHKMAINEMRQQLADMKSAQRVTEAVVQRLRKFWQ